MTLQLGSKERIADVPILQVRDLLMRSGGSFREDWLTDKGMPKQVCGELVNLGYIAKSSDP